MQSAIDALKLQLGLQAADHLPPKIRPQTTSLTGILPWLATRQVHEFCDPSSTTSDWHPPLSLLSALAMQLTAPSSSVSSHDAIAWVGRRSWPTFQFLQHSSPISTPVSGAASPLSRHLFL